MFSAEITAEHSAGGELIFRDHDGRAHVAVHLEDDVLGTLNLATPLQHELMVRHLIGNLATQVRARYDPNKVGEFALRVVGTLKMLG